MAKLTSKDLEKRLDDIRGKINELQGKYAELALEGKSDPALASEISALETELRGTAAAVGIAKQLEAEAEEKRKAEARKSAQKEALKLREKALEQLAEVINQFLLTLDIIQEFNQTVARGNEIMRLHDIPGTCLPESEYAAVILNIQMGAAAIQDAWPRRSYAGIDNLHRLIAERLPQKNGKL